MSLARRSFATFSFVAPAGLAAVLALSFALPPSSARAGEPPPAAAAAPAAVVPPRQAALDVVIRRLERHLSLLRKARTELESGRTEPVPVDEAARRRVDVDLRALRDASRYEGARAKAVATLVEAETSRDAAKVADAKAALDTLDAKLLDGMKKLEESLEALPNQAAKGTAGEAVPPKHAPSTAPKKAPKETTKAAGASAMSAMSEGDPARDADGESIDDDEGDDDGTDDVTDAGAAPLR